MNKAFDVCLPADPAGRTYPVWCGGSVATALRASWPTAWSRAVIIGDSHTAPQFGPTIAGALKPLNVDTLQLQFPAGEEHKTRASKAALEDAMLAASIDRNACIIAVGGGIALDLAGYVAATYMRGIAHIAVATSLLAQVDAAIGGKTAINTTAGKNLIGAFYQPRAVLLWTGALASLPAAELGNGWAELIKHAALCDAALFRELEEEARRRASKISERAAAWIPSDAIIQRAARIKADVVAQDERDGGIRQILNFGHTAAHGIEHASEPRMAHGAAVAVGMLIEAEVAATAGDFPRADLLRLRQLLDDVGLPTKPPCDYASARRYMAMDKKTHAGRLHCAIPQRLGKCAPQPDRTPAKAWLRTVSDSEFEAAWEATTCSA